MIVCQFTALVYNAVYKACLLNLFAVNAVAVCLYDAFFTIDVFKCFLFSCLVLVY